MQGEWATCPGCHLRHRKRGDGQCPRCGAALGEPSSGAAAAPQARTAAPPHSTSQRVVPKRPGGGRRPIAVAALAVLAAAAAWGLFRLASPGARAVATFPRGRVTVAESETELRTLPPSLRSSRPAFLGELANALAYRRALAEEARRDCMWLRVLDVPTAFSGRVYVTTARVVIEVIDKHGFAAGTFALDADPAGAECRATTESPDVTMHVSDLGTLYLGGTSATALAAVGRIDEHRVGSVAVLEAVLRSATPPWCSTMF